MLLLFANLGDQAVRACRVVFDSDDGAPGPAADHPILAGLGTWARDGTASLPAPPDTETDRIGLQNASQARLFWDAVERLVSWRDTGRVGSAENALIDHLAAAAASLDPAVAGRGEEAARHARISDRTCRHHRQRAVRAARYPSGACHDALLPAPRLRGPLRLHQ